MHDFRRTIARLLPAVAKLREVEWMPVAALFVVGVAVWGFAELAEEVFEGDLQQLDRAILTALRSPNDLADPLGPHWFEDAMRDITALGSGAVLGLLVTAVGGYLWLHGKRHATAYLLAAVFGAMLLSFGLKSLFERPRPDLVPHGARVQSAAFPSGHSLMSAAVFLTLGIMLARYEQKPWVRLYLVAFAMLLTLLVGASRVYLGVHWPTDVVAGWTLGAGWALLCWTVAAYLQRRGVLETKPID